MSDLPGGAQRVQEFLDSHGSKWTVCILPDSTATAQDAARAIGVPVSHIGKSIVFGSDSETVVAVVCGDQRVNVGSLAQVTGCPELKSLKAEEVRRRTGFVIGGVSPFALPVGVRVIVDAQLRLLADCYVAAGHPKAMVNISPETLVSIISAQVASITEVLIQNEQSNS